MQQFSCTTSSELERDWGLALDDDWSADVGGDYAPIIRRFGVGAAAQRQALLARFGLIASGAESARAPNSSVNARSETAAMRSTFKNAYAQRQWCIVPAQCLYVPYFGEGANRAERWRIGRAIARRSASPASGTAGSTTAAAKWSASRC